MTGVLGYSLPLTLLALLILVAVGSILFSGAAIPRKTPRIISTLLRLGIWMGLFFMLLRLALVSVEKEISRRPLAVVIDRSWSMSLPTGTKTTRWDEVKQFLESAEVWDRLRKDFTTEFYTLAEDLSPVTRQAILKAAPPTGKLTRLRKHLLALTGRKPWAGILLVSDGVDTDPTRGQKDVPALHPRVPIISLHPNSPRALRDVAITDVRAPEIAYYKSRFSFTADLEAHGLPKPNLVVRVVAGDRVLSEVMVGENEWQDGRATIKIAFVPDKAGSLGFTVEVPHFPEESTYENNKRAVAVRVLRDRVRVLHVAGQPDWDVRFLRGYLTKNPNIDLVSFFILRSPRDNPEAPQQALSLIPFPYHELFTNELANFDLLIFQNFDFRTYFSPSYLTNIKRYVEEGGAFIMLGGNLSFGRGEYRSTPIEEILPVVIRNDSGEISPRHFRPRVTSTARRHPIFSSHFSPGSLQNLAALWGFHRTLGLQAEGVSLLEHPQETVEGKHLPIIAVRQVGAGRSVAILVDSLWRWMFSGEGGSGRIYNDLWDGMYRWLVRDPSFAYLRLQVPRRVVAGSAVAVEATAFDRNYGPLPGVRPILVEESELTSPSPKLFPVTNEEGMTSVQIKAGKPGLLSLKASLPQQNDEGYRSEIVVEVVPESREFDRQGIDVTYLGKLAKVSQGQVFKLEEAKVKKFSSFYRGATYRIRGKREHPVWDHPFLLLFLLAAGSFEWWYRRRHGAP